MYKRFGVLLLGVFLLWAVPGYSMTIDSYDPKAMEVTSNRYVRPDGEIQSVHGFLDIEGFSLVANTAQAELWLSEAYHTIRLVDRSSGYVWGAIPLENARNLNTSWKSYGGSLVSIECYDNRNTERRYGLLGNAEVDYSLLHNGFSFVAEYADLGISFSGRVTLTDNKLTLELDENSVQETADYRLKSLVFLPYFGSVFEDEVEGWFLLPDGPGALMRFQKPASYIAGFDRKVYGPDLAIDQLGEAQSLNANRPDDYVIPTTSVLMPVYGIAHGIRQNGLLSIIEGGQQYASIVATPAGLGNTRYNSIMVRFEYRQKFGQVTSRSGSSTLMPQEQMNVFTPKQSFYVLSGPESSYDQMAVYYRNLLAKEEIIGSTSSDAMSLRLETLGADVKQTALWKRWQVFTTMQDIADMVAELQSDGIDRISVVLKNYTKGNKPGKFLNANVGSESELLRLEEMLQASGGHLALYLDPLSANGDQINLRLQAAHNMSRRPIQIVRNNWDVMYPATYFYRMDAVVENIQGHQSHFSTFDLAVDQLGGRLFGDFTSDHENTRTDNMVRFVSLVEGLSQGRKLALYTPNQLMWPFATSFYDVPLVNGQYLYETDTVPFLPIVLKGSLALYGPPLNTTFFGQNRILRMIEYGTYPSFIVTQAESRELTDTPLEDLYSTAFADWSDYIVDTYLYMEEALQHVEGQKIVSHQAINLGQVMVEYENGIIILINYMESPWESPFGVVAAQDYIVVEGGVDL